MPNRSLHRKGVLQSGRFGEQIAFQYLSGSLEEGWFRRGWLTLFRRN